MTDTSLDSTRIGTSRVRGARRTGQDRTGREGSRLRTAALHKPSLLIIFFVIALVLPNYFFIGSLRLSVYRTILLLMFIPLVFQWLSGRAGGLKSIDFMVLGHGLWIMLALFVAHGTGRFQISGVLMMETVVPFLLARVYVRTPEDFAYFIKAVCWAVAFMLPLAVVEALTGRILISEILGNLTPVYPDLQNEERLGMQRAQGPFEHPILFGVFCATLFSAAFLVWGHNLSAAGRTVRAAVVGLATFFSLSMGAYVSLMIQGGLLVWNRVLRNIPARWTILILGFLVLYIGIDILSNRSPINVITSTLTFRSGAAYNRILIWEFGTAEVYRHPIFGIGFNDWVRPSWMVPSVDNFWLVVAMKFGIPALLMILLPFFITIRKTAKRDFSSDPRVANYRLAYIFGLVGIGLAICTVYVWNATYVFMIFFLGAGVWMWDYKPASETDDETPPDGDVTDEETGKPKYQSARTRTPRHARKELRETRRKALRQTRSRNRP